MDDAEKSLDRIRTLMTQWESPLIRYAMGFTRNLEKAQDVVQDTFLKLCKQDFNKIESYVVPWLFKVCRNRALELGRKDQRQIPINPEIIENLTSQEESPDIRAKNQDSVQQILGVMETLPSNQREVVRLKFHQDLSYKEIAKVTALSVSNVGFLIHTALKTIRKKIEQDETIFADLKRRGTLS
jgi:RNA polymerase sigma-70 factor (ECF subfamily)